MLYIFYLADSFRFFFLLCYIQRLVAVFIEIN